MHIFLTFCVDYNDHYFREMLMQENMCILSGHYQSRDMPSSGAVPFLQSLICNSDNKCYESEAALNVIKQRSQRWDIGSLNNERLGNAEFNCMFCYLGLSNKDPGFFFFLLTVFLPNSNEDVVKLHKGCKCINGLIYLVTCCRMEKTCLFRSDQAASSNILLVNCHEIHFRFKKMEYNLF